MRSPASFLAATRLWLAVLFASFLLAACEPGQDPLPGSDGPEARYVASSQGQVYYRSGCAAAERLSEANRIHFATAEEAEAAGYRASTARGCAPEGAAPRAATGAPDTTAPPRPAGEARRQVPEGAPCVVRSVSDGDTLTCEDGTRVRLLLIDAPETAQAPYGTQARDALQRMLPTGSRVTLEHDVQPRDRYGRTLAYVWTAEGVMANLEMVRQGYAVSLTYPPNVRYVDEVRAAVEEARAARRALWATEAFECSPRDFRAGRC
jgi:micrococcal nuclease